jgi:hypothetical protein
MERLENAWGRKIIVICSDGQDNAGAHDLDDVLLESLNSSDITVMALGTAVVFKPPIHWLGYDRQVREGRHILEEIANGTGGYAFFPKNIDELDQAMEKLRLLIRSQYSLGYRSMN